MRNARNFGVAGLCILAGATTAIDASAQVPSELTQQGRLFDSSDTPVDGQLSFTFTIYDETGMTTLWTETQAVTLDDGYYSARLGESTAIGMAASSRIMRKGTIAPRSSEEMNAGTRKTPTIRLITSPIFMNRNCRAL